MNIRTYICIGILAMSATVQAQTLKAYLIAAENSLAEKDYYSAYGYFSTAVGIDSSNTDSRFKLAEAARMYHAYGQAERMYSSVVEDKNAEQYPQAAYWLGYVQHIQGKYDTAIASYQIFLSEFADEQPEMAAEAERLIASCQWAVENFGKVDDSTSVAKLDSGVNTEYSEIAAIENEELLYFSRLGFERYNTVKNREVPPAQLYSKVLSIDTSGVPAPLDSTLNDPLLHTAHTTFSHDGNRVYYTICEYLNKSDIRCDLYFREIVEGVWGEPQKLPEPINIDTFTNTQPNVAYDDRFGAEVLYFVSDRDGGQGGLDIWYSVINDDETFTTPENLERLNTAHDDITPFLHEESSTFYFSSDGRTGFGGYDIFKSEIDSTGLTEPVNLGPAINSSYHDVYYVLTDDEASSYFSSNKVGSLYLDANDQACCYDVYEVQREPVEVNLIVETYNKMTGEPLTDVLVYIEQRNGEVIQVSQTTGDSNTLVMPIKRNKQFTITGTKENFDSDTKSFSTYHIHESRDIVQQLYLDPSDVLLQVRTFDLRQRLPLPNVSVVLLDGSGLSLAEKVDPYNHIQYFNVRPNSPYALIGTRKGYRKANASIAPGSLLNRDTLVVDLFLELGNLEDFLPLAIYFDNDKPEPKSTKGTTGVRYLETYEPYYKQKDRFISRYTRGLSGVEEQEAAAAVTAFFEENLLKSKEEFESFLNILHQYLDEGLWFKIFLKGYTSPLATADYNYALGQRRIQTIQNEFAEFRGGVLKKYFESGDLEVLEKSFGEETAPEDVSDDPADLRGSIYSPAASRERRVEIIEIEKDNPQQ